MKKLFILICFAFLTKISQSQTVIFNNSTNVYYGATFNTSSISGSCPSTPATTYYMDVPNNYSYSQADFFDENGNTITNVSDITGITLVALTSPPAPSGTVGSGATYIIPFCDAGIPVNSGDDTINEDSPINLPFPGAPPTTVDWSIIPGPNLIMITIY